MRVRSGGFRPGGGGYGAGGGFRFGHGFPMTPWVLRLVLANVAVFLIQGLGILPPPVWESLAFRMPGFLVQPWSIVTYMFLHGSFAHLFGNMLVLFFFGPPLESHWGGRFFIRFYTICGLGGAVFSVLLYRLIGPTLVIGASGAIFGLLLAFAMNWPDAKIYLYFLFPVPAKWFVAILGLFTLYATASGAGGGIAHWTHLGGMVFGFVTLRYGERIGRGVKRAFVKDPRSRVRVERGGSTGKGAAPRSASRPRRGVDGDSLDEVDRILDKIREHGMDSLTARERAFLDEMSRRYRDTPETRVQ